MRYSQLNEADLNNTNNQSHFSTSSKIMNGGGGRLGDSLVYEDDDGEEEDDEEEIVYSAFDQELKSIDLSDSEKLRIRNSLLLTNNTPSTRKTGGGAGGNFFSNYKQSGRFRSSNEKSNDTSDSRFSSFYKYLLLFLTFLLNVNA